MTFCRIFSAFLLSLLVFSSQASACNMTFRIFEFPPMAIKAPNGQWSGTDIQYARTLMEAVDCEMAIIVAPWARGLKMLKAGTVDFMVNMSKTSAREQHYYFVGPHRIENIRLLAKKGALEPITTLTQLTASKAYVMRQKGSYFGKRFEQIVSAKAVKLLELPNNNIRMDLLLKGRIDGFLADENYINSVIKDIPQSDQLLIHPLVINSNPVYYAFSKASVSAAQIDKIRQAFRVLSKTKAYQAIAL